MTDDTPPLTLYYYDGCPFCHRVLGFLRQTGIELPLKNILRDARARSELLHGGGRTTVPCLRITRPGGVRWLYESLDIIDYLRTDGGR